MSLRILKHRKIHNLFLVMSDLEKEKAWELARLIRRDKNLSTILSARQRYSNNDQDSILESLKISGGRLNGPLVENE